MRYITISTHVEPRLVTLEKYHLRYALVCHYHMLRFHIIII